jgi:hypothetical protein
LGRTCLERLTRAAITSVRAIRHTITPVLERGVVASVNQRAAAGRDHRRPRLAALWAAIWVVREAGDHLALQRPEPRFSIFRKDRRDWFARARRQFGIAIDQPPSQPRRDHAADRALAGRHEARED